MKRTYHSNRVFESSCALNKNKQTNKCKPVSQIVMYTKENQTTYESSMQQIWCLFVQRRVCIQITGVELFGIPLVKG